MRQANPESAIPQCSPSPRSHTISFQATASAPRRPFLQHVPGLTVRLQPSLPSMSIPLTPSLVAASQRDAGSDVLFIPSGLLARSQRYPSQSFHDECEVPGPRPEPVCASTVPHYARITDRGLGVVVSTARSSRRMLRDSDTVTCPFRCASSASGTPGLPLTRAHVVYRT